jgi:zinc protease
MKVSVVAREQSPSSIAEEAFYKAVYGNHPYAEPSGGTKESLERLSLDAIKVFYQQYYVANNAVIIVVGDLDQKDAADVANQLVANLPAGKKPEALPEVVMLTEEKFIRIEYPSKQSHIYMGQPGMKRGDEDYFALYMGNHSFGGSGFTSRLVDTVREQRGLAYSVYSYFSPMREAGPFMMGMQTRADQTDEALGLLKSELVTYINEGPGEQELQDSISNVVGSFPLNLDSNSKLLGYLAMIGFYDLPEDYLQNFVANVEAVDRSDIKDAFKRRVHADKMVTVIVGSSSE